MAESPGSEADTVGNRGLFGGVLWVQSGLEDARIKDSKLNSVSYSSAGWGQESRGKRIKERLSRAGREDQGWSEES